MVSEQLLGAAKTGFSHIEIRTILRCREARGPAWYAGIRIFVCALPPMICIYLLCRDEHLFSVWARRNRCNVT